VFALAGAPIVLSRGSAGRSTARRAGLLALWAALGAVLIDIYTY